MRKILLLGCAIVFAPGLFAQNTRPRLELNMAPGLFFEGMADDAMVPRHERGNSRLGDDMAADLTASFMPAKSSLVISAGLGYRVKHYSMAKYNIGDFLASLFAFDSPARRDTFALARVRYTNQYFEVPISVSAGLLKRRHGLPVFTLGVNIRPGFLLSSHAQITPDSLLPSLPSPAAIAAFEKAYTQDETKFVVTIEPFFKSTIYAYKGMGFSFHIRPFSIYSSPLNKKLTTRSVEFLGLGFGVTYDFNK